MSLERLVESARALSPDWNDARARRVLDAARRAHARRTFARGSLAFLTVAALAVVMVRGARSPAHAEEVAPDDVVAARVDALDAGYAHD